MKKHLIAGTVLSILMSSPASAEWNFSGPSNANAFIQTDNMTLELQCDRVRFAPAGYEDAQDIVAKQGLSFRFMKDGSTEVGAFQAGSANADISIVDNYPVEVRFFEQDDYDFVLDQIAQNAVLNLSMVEQDITYGIFTLKGSSAAIKSLRAACNSGASVSQTMEAPEGIVYCGGGAVQRVIEYAMVGQPGDQWDAIVTVNGETVRAMTSYSFFGNSQPPAGFEVALLGEDRSEFLVFSDEGRNWIEFGDYTYEQCN
ncbi:hypothetical protein [Falsiruegeria mediterranea]|uniref:C-type lysozyme inhibitor domain-containing protein n=1 Tax=Falsiruegeria mediterranea M17 TaxID=1200281 RepID=A0A2R8C733_9RHOB|nr:hypothetical protein [Falsiruegeria mediterranea]SPJ28239.1 hypothetical protein TRM7615_01736 [Falsiruegeria mediterranea M17]